MIARIDALPVMQVALVMTLTDRKTHCGLDNLLQAFGFEVCFIRDGREIAGALNRVPALVVLDLAAPPVNAIGYLNRLSRENPHVQAVLMRASANHTGIEVVEFDQTVAFGWLTHAWHLDDLGDLENRLRRNLPVTEFTRESLLRALDNQELILHYQPIFDLRKHAPEAVAVEALVRWIHPELGLLMPGQFLPWMEARGLMVQLTDQTLELTAEQVTVWKRQGFLLPISVNISATLLTDDHFPARLTRGLKELSVEPQELTLEISECGIMSQRPELVRVVAGLIDHGFRLVIDDFGRDCVSLLQVVTLPFSAIKLDECLIRQMNRNERVKQLVSSIIRLAHDLGMQTCAENVETAETMFLLKGLGCDQAQGWYFSRPVSAGSLSTR